MKQTTRSSVSPLYMILGLVIIVGGIVWVGTWKQNKYSSAQVQEKDQLFTSGAIDFSVEIPSNFLVEEKINSVYFKADKKNEEIRVSRIGTNFSNLSDHIAALEKLNDVDFQKTEDLTINNLPVQSGILNSEKTYFIYVSNWVYSLSTSSESLYTDLDHIAQSFRYTP